MGQKIYLEEKCEFMSLTATCELMRQTKTRVIWYFDDFLEAKDLGHYSTFLFVHKKILDRQSVV